MTERNTSHRYLTGGNGMAVSGDHEAQCAAMAELVAGYALYALEPDEAERVERHRANCPNCAGIIATFERTASLLPFLALRATPAPDVKASLFARIAHADQPAFATHSSDLAAGGTQPFLTSTVNEIPAATPTIPASSPRPVAEAGGRGRSGRLRRWIPFSWRDYSAPIATTAIPLVLALALLGGWAYQLYDQAQEAEADQERLSAINGLIARDGGTVYSLTANKTAPDAAGGQLLASPNGTTGVLMVHGLTEFAGQTYVVWIEWDGQMAPYDTLELDSRGNGQMLIQLDHSFKRCRGIYVQLVPADDPAGTNSVNVLSTTLTTPGPAVGGDPTEGNPQIGSNGVSLLQYSSK